MYPKQKAQTRFISLFLSLVLAVVSLFTYCQPAFASNDDAALLESHYLEDFLCVKAQFFPASRFVSNSNYFQDRNIRSLSNQLASCVKSNRLKDVDLSRLINVFYTSQIDQEKGLVGVVVAAGNKPRTPLSLSTGHTENKIKVEITNFSEIDGTVIKVGTPLRIQARARDGQGRSLDNSIIWSQNGERLGKGSALTYTPSKSEVIDLIASVPTPNGDSYAKVTFSADPSDGALRNVPDVKPFSPQLGEAIITVNAQDPNRICFKQNPTDWKGLPTIKRGDIIIHPYDVPPRKILSIDGNCVDTRIAFIYEFFPETKRPFSFSELTMESEEIARNGKPLLTPVKENLKPGKLTNQWVNFETNDPKVKRGVPKIVENCNRDAYSMRYYARQDGFLNTSYNQQTQENEGANISKPNKPYNSFLPEPKDIVPPSNQFYQLNLKEFLEDENESKEISTNYDNNTTSKFKPQAKSSTQTIFDLQAYFGFKFEPEILKDSSKIGFNPKYLTSDPLNGFSFTLDLKATEVLIGGFTGNALKEIKPKQLNRVIPIPTGLDKTASAPRTPVFFVGYVPVWISFPILMKLPISAEAKMSVQDLVAGFIQVGYFNIKPSYAPERSSSTRFQLESDNDSINATVFCGKANMDAVVRAAIKPTVQVLFWSVFGPETGIEGYTSIDFDPPKPILEVDSVKTAFNQADIIQLTARAKNSLTMPMTTKAGVDALLTIMTINEEVNEVSKKINEGIKKYYSRAGKGSNEVVEKVCSGLFSQICTNPRVRKVTDKIENFFAEDGVDLNNLLRKYLTLRKNIKSWQDTPKLEIPLNNPVFKISSLFDESRVLWKLEDGKAFASSNPGQTIQIDSCTLPSGKHTITAEMYYSPFDNRMADRDKMVSERVFDGTINASPNCS
ncbi:hypothetical protein NIES2107_72440 (plasmid) [Nostoc carneum NIES-2107]|nr:hypothetical protein NIES2107_72440 [Nostoc carneum NIES-2107]